jgi:hypothetical protein
MPYSAYCLFFVPPNKRLDPVLCSIGKWLIHLFDNYVMIIFLAWEPRSHEPKRKAIGSGFMRTRLPGQEEICDVMVIEMVYSVTSLAYQGLNNLTACQQDVFALLVPSCCQVWNKFDETNGFATQSRCVQSCK